MKALGSSVLASFLTCQKHFGCFWGHFIVCLQIHSHSHRASDPTASEDATKHCTEMFPPFLVNQNLKLAPGYGHFVCGGDGGRGMERRIATGNEETNFNLELASSLLWQVNVVSLRTLWSCGIFFSASGKGVTSTLRKPSLCLSFILLLLLLSGSGDVREIFLPVVLLVFVTLQVLQVFFYLKFEFGARCFWY